MHTMCTPLVDEAIRFGYFSGGAELVDIGHGEPFTYWRFSVDQGLRRPLLSGEALIHTLEVDEAVREVLNPRQRELLELIYLLVSGREPEKARQIKVSAQFDRGRGGLVIFNLRYNDAMEIDNLLFWELGIFSGLIQDESHRFGTKLVVGVNHHYGTDRWLPCMSGLAAGFDKEAGDAFAGHFRLHQQYSIGPGRYNPGIIGTGE